MKLPAWGSVLGPVSASSMHHPLDILPRLQWPSPCWQLPTTKLPSPDLQTHTSKHHWLHIRPIYLLVSKTQLIIFLPTPAPLLFPSACLCWWHHTHPTSQIQDVEVIRELNSTPHSQQSSLGICPFPSIPVVCPSSSLFQIIAATS